MSLFILFWAPRQSLNTSEGALSQAGLSGRPFHSLPLDPNLAVTLAILGAPSETSQAPVERPRPFSEIRCLSLCVSVMSSSVPHRSRAAASFLYMLILDQVITSSDKLISVIQAKINLLEGSSSFSRNALQMLTMDEIYIKTLEIFDWPPVDSLLLLCLTCCSSFQPLKAVARRI